jgi:hypothetical protein
VSKPMRVFVSPLTGRAYATSDYTELPGGAITARTKHDVTADVVEDAMATAWARGWNECNAADDGAAPPNPYRPTAEPETSDESRM